MFGNMLGDFQKKQEEMLAKTAQMVVEVETEGVTIKANGAKEILNISIDPSVLSDKEQLEDLLVVGINRALAQAGEQAAAEAQKLMEQMLPPGMGNLKDLFGG